MLLNRGPDLPDNLFFGQEKRYEGPDFLKQSQLTENQRGMALLFCQ